MAYSSFPHHRPCAGRQNKITQTFLGHLSSIGWDAFVNRHGRQRSSALSRPSSQDAPQGRGSAALRDCLIEELATRTESFGQLGGYLLDIPFFISQPSYA